MLEKELDIATPLSLLGVLLLQEDVQGLRWKACEISSQRVPEKTPRLNCKSSLSGEHQLAQQLNEPSSGGWDSVEEVDDSSGNLELLLPTWLVLSLLLGHNSNLQPLLEVLKQLLAQLLAEHIAEQLGEVGKPLDETEIQISVVGILIHVTLEGAGHPGG